jgi:hypothetical protein
VVGTPDTIEWMWDVPWDLVLFGVVVAAFFVIGLPLITRRVSVPRRIVFEDVGDHEMTGDQTRYFADLDPDLLEMGFRTVNMQGRALVRTYMSDADPAIITMNLLTSGVEGANEHPMNFLEIVTRYGDGTVLSTRNAEISEVLDVLPMHVVQERKGVKDPGKLKLTHDKRARDLLIHGPLYSSPDDFVQVFDEFHERWCLHQIEKGLLVPRSDDPQRLRPTVKAGLRGIANFLNPIADNLTMQRFLLAVVLGITVPAAAMAWLAGPGLWLVDRTAAVSGLTPESCLLGCMGVLVTGVGVVVGLLFVGKSFIWSFLLTYILLRLIGPAGLWATVALGLWSGIVANWAAGRRERRHHLA